MKLFIQRFLASTTAPMYVASLTNEKFAGPERHVASRDVDEIVAFVEKQDVPENARGVYFAVSSMKGARNKENAQETPALHADVDFKSIEETPKQAYQKIMALKCSPSLVIGSGNGLHCYWPFKKALPASDEVDDAIKLAAAKLGADSQPAHEAAFMRVPGTHNSKNGEWKEVLVLDDNPRRYDLQELRAFFSSMDAPVLTKKGKSPGAAPGKPKSKQDFFLVAGDNIKQPIDVEQRLKDMTFKGEGDSAIHPTQVSVTASLIGAGVGIDDAVERVLEATRRAAGSAKWNWKKEETMLRKMCIAWRRKLDAKGEKAVAVGETQSDDGEAEPDNVVSLSKVRADKQQKKAERDLRIGMKTKPHIVLGEKLLEFFDHEDKKIMFVGDELYVYADGLWERKTTSPKTWLNIQIETVCVGLGFPTSNRLVEETRKWVERQADLYRDKIDWDAHGKIATKSGLLNPETGKLEDIKPEHYCTRRMNVDYDPKAKCPLSLRMLDDIFADRSPKLRAETIGVIQDFMGSTLIAKKSKWLRKAFVAVGASNSAKSSVIEVMSGLISDQVNGTTFEQLEKTHGTSTFKVPLPWVLHEAFNRSRWHLSDLVKQLISGDPILMNEKNRALVSQSFDMPVIWGTNYPPSFREDTKAIVERLLIFNFKRVFTEPVGVAAEGLEHGYDKPSTYILDREKSGLLNWALAGWRRLHHRGRFELTDEMRATLHEVFTDSNLVAGFIEECCIVGPKLGKITVNDFCASFEVWWKQNRGENSNAPLTKLSGVRSNLSVTRTLS